MKSILSATLLALLAADVSAFYPYMPPSYKPAAKKVHVGKHIAKAMGLEKLSLHRRAVKRDSVERRVNDFEITTPNQPSTPNSAAIAEDNTDYSYFCDVVLGTNPGLHVYLLMDTGSSVLWVMGEDCETQACKEHDQFGINDSTTYKTGAGDFFIQYATGNVSGDVITDHVGIAGFDLTMDFGVAKTTTDEFANYPIDGILGLARTPGPGPNIPTFLQILQKNGLVKSNIFGMNLQRAADGTNDGEINFGTIDTTKFQGDLNWQNTVGDLSRWTVPIDGITVNGQFTELSGDRTAIIDTGTSYLYIPPTDAKPIFDAIPGETPIVNGSYVIPCNTNAEISLVFNGIAYNLPLKDYVGLPLGNGCVSHIFPQDVVGDGKTWLVGDTFLKNVYTVFDSDQSRVGFGAKGSTSTITSLVQTPTPSVSAGSNQILSALPTAAPSGSSSATVVAAGSTPLSTTGSLPIGAAGQPMSNGTTTAAAADTSAGPVGAASSAAANGQSGSTTSSGSTRTGAGSAMSPLTVAQSMMVALFGLSIMML